MRLNWGEVLAEAGVYWRGGAAPLVAVASIFFLLPDFAIQLWMPVPDLSALEGEAYRLATMAFLRENAVWLAARFVSESMGVGTLLLLLLDPARLSVGEALVRALRLLPGLAVARLIAFAGTMLGAMLLFVPGFYIAGRTFITSATYVCESQRGPVGATLAGFERTRGNGWKLFMLAFAGWAVSALFGGTVLQMALTAEPLGQIATGPLRLLAAAIGAGAMLFVVLLEAAAYRALTTNTGM
ncbi:MAG: hypothetical protein ACAH11_06040 [Sphingomonas sp.]